MTAHCTTVSLLSLTYLLHTEAVLGLTGWLYIELQATTS